MIEEGRGLEGERRRMRKGGEDEIWECVERYDKIPFPQVCKNGEIHETMRMNAI